MFASLRRTSTPVTTRVQRTHACPWVRDRYRESRACGSAGGTYKQALFYPSTTQPTPFAVGHGEPACAESSDESRSPDEVLSLHASPFAARLESGTCCTGPPPGCDGRRTLSARFPKAPSSIRRWASPSTLAARAGLARRARAPPCHPPGSRSRHHPVRCGSSPPAVPARRGRLRARCTAGGARPSAACRSRARWGCQRR
mmetsp:Transcript_43180/g.107680  ORF Transcript_43180/g.107680 Transcript_43180/m.107680 type:complete len:200 (-) Transcript_43180:438-1037(-)